MDRRQRLVKVGFALTISGLCVATTSLIPGLLSLGSFPWTLMGGTLIYLPGSFMVMIGSRGGGMKESMGKLRFVRLGFFAVFAFALMKLANG